MFSFFLASTDLFRFGCPPVNVSFSRLGGFVLIVVDLDRELCRYERVAESGLSFYLRSEVRLFSLFSLAALYSLASCRCLDFALRPLKLRSAVVMFLP